MNTPSIEVLHELVEPARKALSKETWDYLMGGADTETTLERNRLGFEALAFRPRVLRDVGSPSTHGDPDVRLLERGGVVHAIA